MSEEKTKASGLGQLLYIVLFLLLCLLPSLGMLIVGESEASANEILASKPVLIRRDGSLNGRVLNDTADYLADRFAMRRELITVWSTLEARLLGTSAEEQVVLGKDGWLYYASTLDDYMGRSMSEEELEKAARNLAALQQAAESRGARFAFTIAPNKNSLYPEQMPRYIPADHANANAVRLRPYLEQYCVNYVDLFSVFSAREETLYYHGDSHWTERGAALAADTLLAAMDKESQFFDGAFTAGEPHLGDLYEMLFPTGRDREPSEALAAGFSYTLDGDPRGGNALRIVSACEGRGGSLLCWRDSFGIALYPYLAESFGEATFLRGTSYDPAQIEKSGADTVLLEIVERNLPDLAALDESTFH